MHARFGDGFEDVNTPAAKRRKHLPNRLSNAFDLFELK
jgi:hypothetical protein